MMSACSMTVRLRLGLKTQNQSAVIAKWTPSIPGITSQNPNLSCMPRVVYRLECRQEVDRFGLPHFISKKKRMRWSVQIKWNLRCCSQLEVFWENFRVFGHFHCLQCVNFALSWAKNADVSQLSRLNTTNEQPYNALIQCWAKVLPYWYYLAETPYPRYAWWK